MWCVLAKQGPTITIGLFRRDRDEEADRLVTDDPRLSHFLAGRVRSDEPRIERDRDEVGRARQARPRDRLGRPLPYGSPGSTRCRRNHCPLRRRSTSPGNC